MGRRVADRSKRGGSKVPRKEAELTDNEGSLLALVLRRQPIKPYRLLKIYEDSPVSSFNESKGNLYPIIRRLIAAGLLVSSAVPGDRRRSEELSCTEKGREAVQRWVRRIQPSHILLNDPLRTKIMSFDLLEPAEQRAWVAELGALVEEKRRDVEAYAAASDLPMQRLAIDNVMRALDDRLTWLGSVAETIGKKRPR
jgi:DNA-binding PadR family transcriptional regulator